MFRTYITSRSHNGQSGHWQSMHAEADLPEVSQLPFHSNEQESSGSLKLTNTRAQDVFGFVYHTGPQSLAVSVPGDVAPVKFGCHTVLSGVSHDEQSSDVFIETAGVYEISYSIIISAATTAHAAFALQADGEKLPGSLISLLVRPEEGMYSAMALAELKENTSLRLIMTSGSTCSAELNNSGVSASLLVKKLN